MGLEGEHNRQSPNLIVLVLHCLYVCTRGRTIKQQQQKNHHHHHYHCHLRISTSFRPVLFLPLNLRPHRLCVGFCARPTTVSQSASQPGHPPSDLSLLQEQQQRTSLVVLVGIIARRRRRPNWMWTKSRNCAVP